MTLTDRFETAVGDDSAQVRTTNPPVRADIFKWTNSGVYGSIRYKAYRQRISAFNQRFQQYYLLVALLLILLLLGWILRLLTGSLSASLTPYRAFFQLAIAAVLIATLRNELGMSTYGLFAPVILALTLTTTGLVWGLALFLNIFVIALGIYYIVLPFNVGTAHRLGTIIAVVAITVATFLFLGDIGLLPRLSGTIRVFFPAIITAWYAERFASDVEERGWTVPSIQFLWTLVAIVVAYAIISTRPLVDWFLGTPESWVALVGLSIYLGVSTRIRLKEYYRFSAHWNGVLTGMATRVQLALRNLLAWVRQEEGRAKLDDVLTMNVRNKYITRYNPGHLRQSASKVETKRRLLGLDISTPAAYAIVESMEDLQAARRVVESRESFVVKPDDAYGGEGIIVVRGRTGETYETSRGPMTADGIVKHVRKIVQGQYAGLALDGKALVEARVEASPVFAAISAGGVPDIRIIVFRGYPVIAMTRLPTVASNGQANLHQGAVGVGLAVADGTPVGADQQSQHRWVDRHPDTGADLSAFPVPNWDDVLTVAVRTAAASGLGYAGVDIALDHEDTPQVFEVNAYPGLGIQNTTRTGILTRLRFIDDLSAEYEFYPTARKVRLAKQWATEGYQ